MQIGDLAMFFDGHSDCAEPVLITKLCDHPDVGLEALVMNELGEHWVDMENLATMEESEKISECR